MAEPRQYALVVARWAAGEWVASVVEDEAGVRVVHLHHAGCLDGSCGVDTARVGWTVAEAIAFAEGKRDEMLAECLPYWGPPHSIDTFVEATGDGERLETRIRKGPPPPRQGTHSSRAMRAAAGAAGLVAVVSALRSWSPAQWLIALLPLAVAALVGLSWLTWKDRQVVDCWRRAMAEGHERQCERVTNAARRLRATGRPPAPRLAA